MVLGTPAVFSKKLYEFLFVCTIAGIPLLSACREQEQSGPGAPSEAPAVVAIAVEESPFSQSMEFIGETRAFHKVELRARVTGYLTEKGFKDGEQVKRGQMLLRIDPAEYETALGAANAGLERAMAEQLNSQQQLDRVTELVKKDTVSQAQLDEKTAQEAAARANVSAAESDVEKAKLNLGYTEIESPIDGRIGKSQFDVGNLVGPDSGVLASVVAQDPIQVVFSVSEKTYLTLQADRAERGSLDARIRLANGEMFENPGQFSFVDNQVDTATGTIPVYMQFPNPDGELLPGLFVTVILSADEQEEKVLVPQSVVQLDQSGPFVLLVDGDSKVEIRRVTTGERRDADIVIDEGLEEGETVIVEGIQKVRPGMTVSVSYRNPAGS